MNYGRLQELIDEVENQKNAEARPAHGEPSSPSFLAKSAENARIEDFTELSSEDFLDTKCCELSQNRTENTSKENNSRELSLPHLPCVGEEKKDNNQEEQESGNRLLDNQEEINSVDFPNPEQDTSSAPVEQNIN